MFKNIDELIDFTKDIIGKKFKDLNTTNKKIDLSKDKGILGKLVETGFYGYPNNSFAEADFKNLGVELKVSGYIQNQNGTIRAKERIKLSSINYKKIINEKFNYSKLISKNFKILFIWYEYKKGVNPENFIITKYQLYNMENDLFQIENDFNKIVKKVKDGEAHLISEGMTTYLGACTSGNPNSNSYICEQPNSVYNAKRRAFSLKNSYINGILHQDGIVLEADKVEYLSVEDFVSSQMKKYVGEIQLDILRSINPKLDYRKKKVPKQIGYMISSRAIGKVKDLNKYNDLFRKTKSLIKNIPVDCDMIPIERVSFRQLKLDEFDCDWQESEWYHMFNDFQVVLCCFQAENKHVKNGFRKYITTKSFYFNEDELEIVKKSYEMVQNTIRNHNIDLLPYPKSFQNQIVEVAPKGIKGDACYKNFLKNNVTKVCFMLDKDFVYKKLTE